MPLPSVDMLEALTSGAGAQVLEAAMDMGSTDPAGVARLRRQASPETVVAALEVAAARRSLQGRVAGWRTYWADREGAAQASDDASAAWKAARVAGRGAMVDLCCGTGADLRALAKVTAARGVDLRPERAWMARHNAGVEACCSDATALDFEEPLAHLDPARRDETAGRRLHAWDQLVPGPAFLRQLSARLDGLMAKLGPGVEIPQDARPAGSELAFLSRRGGLTQAVLCTGVLARHAGASAVLLDQGVEVHGPSRWSATTGDPAWPAAGEWSRFIAEPDASLERSGLLSKVAAEHGLRERAPGLGLCTRPEAPDATTPWFRWFERLETCAARLEPLQRRMRALGAGPVDVKVRGGAADADAWSRALRGDGTEALVVLVHRMGAGAEAVIARRRDPA